MTDDQYELARLLRAAAVGALHYLTHGDASSELAAKETEFHHGDDPIEADKEAQRHFEEAAHDYPNLVALRVVAIVGEERIERLEVLQPGERVIVVDPLDGSKPWTLIRAGYCVAALVLGADSDGALTIECAIIATPTEAFTLLGTNLLLHGPLDGTPESDLVVASVVPEADWETRSWAAVAYKPEDRLSALPVAAKLPDWAFVTLGGNPMAPYVLTGRLTALVTLKATSTWDSIGLLMASCTDAVLGDHEGRLLSSPVFRGLFAQVLLEGNVTPIPKLIVAKSMSAYSLIVEAFQRARADRRSWHDRRIVGDRRTTAVAHHAELSIERRLRRTDRRMGGRVKP